LDSGALTFGASFIKSDKNSAQRRASSQVKFP